MTETKNNHYIPQLLIRKFGERVNSYNIHTQETQENVKPKNVFYEKRFYSQELEDLLAKKVEGPFGDLINNKILPANRKLVLTREEIMLLKKYIVLSWLRTPTYENNSEILEPLCEFQDALMGREFEERTEENFEKDLKELILADEIELGEIARKTKSSALRYYILCACASYFAFWDSTKSGEDFILTNEPFITNHGRTNYGFQGMYILGNVMPRVHPQHAPVLLASMTCMGDYYVLYPISKTRTIVMCSPFMKFFDMESECKYLGLPPFTVKDICGISTRTVFAAPKITRDNKIKTYTVHDLSKEDVVLNNELLLNEVVESFVFSDFSRIKQSLETFQLGYDISNKKRDYTPLLEYFK